MVYDHRNTGQSTNLPDEPCSMHTFADDAAALMKAVLGNELPVCVIGNSFGGAVAQHIAIRHPQLIKKLIISVAASGGPGGSSRALLPIYQPDVSLEDRVKQKATWANTTRTEEWKRTNQDDWEMVVDLVLGDEMIGSKEPMRQEGYRRQMQAREEHNSWDGLPNLEMPVLCCASPLDDICPPKIVKNLADRIGSNASTMLDFDWGHPLLAADVKAPVAMSKWLREPMPPPKNPPKDKEFNVGWVHVTVGNAKMREEEAMDSPAIISLKPNTSVKIVQLGESPKRIKVVADGKEGWISCWLLVNDMWQLNLSYPGEKAPEAPVVQPNESNHTSGGYAKAKDVPTATAEDKIPEGGGGGDGFFDFDDLDDC